MTRRPTDAAMLERLMVGLGRRAQRPATAYFDAISPSLYRFPSLVATRFEERMVLAFGPRPGGASRPA